MAPHHHTAAHLLQHANYLIPRRTPEEEELGELPDIEGGPDGNKYVYPSWGIGVGVLCVLACCVFFSYCCSFVNRRNNKRAAFLAEFPCLDPTVPLASGLATTTCAAAIGHALPLYKDDVGPTKPAIDRKLPLGLNKVSVPMPVKRAVNRMKGKKETVGQDMGMVEMKVPEEQNKVDSNDPAAKEEEEGVTVHKEGEQSGMLDPEAALGALAEDNDAIMFVREASMDPATPR